MAPLDEAALTKQARIPYAYGEIQTGVAGDSWENGVLKETAWEFSTRPDCTRVQSGAVKPTDVVELTFLRGCGKKGDCPPPAL